MDTAKSRRTISALLKVFKVAAVDDVVIEEALRLAFTDFEDAVTAAAAHAAGCEYIVTRDPKGFRGSPVRAVTPEVLLPLLSRLN
jgi:predicted nucleic acid-binding protein